MDRVVVWTARLAGALLSAAACAAVFGPRPLQALELVLLATACLIVACGWRPARAKLRTQVRRAPRPRKAEARAAEIVKSWKS